MAPCYKMFDCVDLGNGVRGVIVYIFAGSSPQAYVVEVYKCRGSMGDGVVDMYEDGDALRASYPDELAKILAQPANMPEDTMDNETTEQTMQKMVDEHAPLGERLYAALESAEHACKVYRDPNHPIRKEAMAVLVVIMQEAVDASRAKR